MLTGKKLGAAIEAARLAKGVSKKKLADDFDVKPPSVQGWVNYGRIDKAKLMQLIAYFSDVVPLEHWGIDEQVFRVLSTQGETPREPEENDLAVQPETSKKKPLTPELIAECQAANALFLAKKNELKLSQKKIADAVGISPAGVAQYLNGTNPLNAKFAAAFSRLINEPVEKFSPRLAAEIARIAQTAPAPASTGQAGKSGHPVKELAGEKKDLGRKYQDDKYQKVSQEHRHAVDELADKMLGMSEEQALKLKQAMDLLMPRDDRSKD